MNSTPKTGLGYDIHRLVDGRKLILGGVEIPHKKGLQGHSDADVLLHAICDALLGAIGQGDIGEHFPDTDTQYKNISSLILLQKVKELVDAQGLEVGNIDAVVVADEPMLKDFKQEIKKKIAETLTIDKTKINIKATTQEGLGFGSQGQEAIAAYAVAQVI